MLLSETFFDLLRDPAHWGFEMVSSFVFDIVIGVGAWSVIKRHIHRDIEEGTENDN